MVRSTNFDDQHDSFVNGKIFYGVNSFASSFSTKEHSRAHRGFKEGEREGTLYYSIFKYFCLSI